jgi:hypothetical protein
VSEQPGVDPGLRAKLEGWSAQEFIETAMRLSEQRGGWLLGGEKFRLADEDENPDDERLVMVHVDTGQMFDVEVEVMAHPFTPPTPEGREVG